MCKKLAWKVVRNIDGVRWSAVVSPLEIPYAVQGEWTRLPKKHVQCGYGIIVFAGFLDACAFVLPFKHSGPREIWSVETGGRMKLPPNDIIVARCAIEDPPVSHDFSRATTWPNGARAYDKVKMKQLVAIFPGTPENL